MEVLFLCFFGMRAIGARALPRSVRGAPSGGFFVLLVRGNALHADLLLRGVRSPPGAHVLVLRDGIGHCRRLGFTRLVIAVDWISRDWSPGSFRVGRFG